MIWNAPAALAGLLLLAGPVLVHLLVRRHAVRVQFPAMQFVPGVRAAAVRLRRPSDIGLMLLRLAAVAAAVVAAAQPVWITPSRERAWAARLARAVVIDTSASVTAAAAEELANRELRGAPASQRFEDPDLRGGLQRAAAWLGSAAVGRREIVVVSDFQLGSIDAGDLARVPKDVGVRLVRAGPPSPANTRPATIAGWRNGAWIPAVSIGPGGTQVTWRAAAITAPAPVSVLAPDAEMPAARRALEAARSWGVAELPAQRIEIVFAGATTARRSEPRAAWIASATLALRNSPLAAAADPALAVGERDGVMAVQTNVAATSRLAPAVVRAVLDAAGGSVVDRELEPRAVDEQTVSAWQRPPVSSGAQVPPDASDGRWLWALALALVIVESAWRRRRAERIEEVHADAA